MNRRIPLLDDLSPPARVKGAAAEHWNRIAPALRQLEILTVLDRMGLALHCHVVAMWQDLDAQVKAHGVESKKGKPHALVKMRRDALRQVRETANDFIVCERSKFAVHKALPADLRAALNIPEDPRFSLSVFGESEA